MLYSPQNPRWSEPSHHSQRSSGEDGLAGSRITSGGARIVLSQGFSRKSVVRKKSPCPFCFVLIHLFSTVDLRASPGDASFLSLSLFPPPANGSCLAKSLPFFDRNTVPATIDGAKKTSLLARRPANNLIHETLQWSSTHTTHREHTSLSGMRNSWSARSTGPLPATR